MEGEDRKSNIVKATPGEEGEDAVISVKLAPQDGSGVVEIRAKGKTKIKRLVDAWAKQKSINPQSVRLLGPEGQRLNLESTLNEANINDGDQIDVMLLQTGGARE
ncbi:ubiquitinlike protein [Acanthamoeba castellanii str. Neff]|uniref:Ubiquitinlike protein n=1 Tax=Acanthamoeba castellanii (strain ATCC 30010 / Neff) TaxID=1257118 RepID=L8GYI1_ACACF|nr:ubiquitinlike protein [Acanthamoeba castellanii str. Neff]XP_004340366.1 ubiquitinlike protein [Acanthamoeba castellanii str. Neff]ELR13447.1 ubiquitinlike protein [Acanthamoeba castellanii str. Neff]ELR18344.1 ubiquitinlike protein [Acanthamoeba castellanii str. Neff]